jgi:hypothetical protein
VANGPFRIKPSFRVPAKNPLPPLLYADTERSADALYFGRVGVPDPFIAFGLRGKSTPWSARWSSAG